MPGAPSGWWNADAELDPDELRLDDRRVGVVRVAPVARVDWDSASRFVAAACEVLEANRRIARGQRGDARPARRRGSSIVQPPEDPAALGALNRALAAPRRRLALRRAAASSPRTTDSGALVGRVRVLRRYQLETGESGRTGVLATVDGAPWLVRSGDVVLLGSRLDPAWTDLPVSAGFMPFMDALVNRLARGEVSLGRRRARRPGAAARPRLRGAAGRARLAGGGRRRVPAGASPAPTTCSPARDTVGAITANIDPRESLLAPATDAQVRRLWKGARVVSLADAGDAAFSARRARRPARAAALGRAAARRSARWRWRASGGGSRDEARARCSTRSRARPATIDLAERLPGRGRGAPAGRPARLERRGARGLAGRAASRSGCSTIVAPTPGDAERWLTDLAHLTDEGVALYPQREALGEDEPHYEIAGERAETIEALLQGRLRVLVTTARATAERTLMPAALERLRLRLAAGERRPPGEVARDARADGLPPGADGHRGGRVQRARRHPGRVRLRHGGAGAARVVGRRRLVASAGSISPRSARCRS